MKKKPHWTELCQQAAVEQDHEKLMELINEITRFWTKKRSGSDPRPPSRASQPCAKKPVARSELTSSNRNEPCGNRHTTDRRIARSTTCGNQSRSPLHSRHIPPQRDCYRAYLRRCRLLRVRSDRIGSWKVHRISSFKCPIQPPKVLVVGYFELQF